MNIPGVAPEFRAKRAIMHESTSKAQPGRSWATKAEVAAHFGCDKRTIGNLMRRKIIPYVKIRGLLRFNLADCEAAMGQYRSRPFWEREAQSGGRASPGPRQEAIPTPPAPEESAPPAAQPGEPPLTVMRGAFTDLGQLRGALAALIPDLEATGTEPRLPPGVTAGCWILVVVPSAKS